MSKKQSNLPTIGDLTTDIENAFKNDQFNQLVNQEPPQKWVKVHPFIKGHRYLPIDKVEFLLKRIFKRYRIEVLNEKLMMNSMVVRVRVHFLHPVYNEWDWHDGVGAAELQTIKDSGPLRPDMSNVQRGAVPMAAGIAKSVAIKDACDHIGELFGANLNRSSAIPFSGDDSVGDHMMKRVNKMVDAADNIEELEELKKDVPEQYKELFDQKIEWIKSNEDKK